MIAALGGIAIAVGISPEAIGRPPDGFLACVASSRASSNLTIGLVRSAPPPTPRPSPGSRRTLHSFPGYRSRRWHRIGRCPSSPECDEHASECLGGLVEPSIADGISR